MHWLELLPSAVLALVALAVSFDAFARVYVWRQGKHDSARMARAARALEEIIVREQLSNAGILRVLEHLDPAFDIRELAIMGVPEPPEDDTDGEGNAACG